MVNLKEPNLYNAFGVRRVDEFCPAHFESTLMPMRYNLENSILKWIEMNCKGRFFIGKSFSITDNKVSSVLKIGFETQKELSYFMLACPHLKYT